MIVLLVILIITNGLTIYFSSRSNLNLNNNQNLMEQPPSMKQNEDSNYTSKDDTSNDEFNQQFSNENKENNSQNNTQSDGATNNQPPEKPSGEDNKTFPNQNGENAPDGENAPEINSLNSTNISNTYFILFVIQSLAITLIIIYLLMSKFNKKTLKETFISSDKIIIYGLSTIIITSSLTYLDNYVAKNMLIPSSNSNNSTLNNNVIYSSTKEIIENTKLNSGK